MGLKIIISSAVNLPEKTSIKEHLIKMQKQHIISIDSIYDCNEHSTILGGGVMGGAKQEEIDALIKDVNWFICLAPFNYVGKATSEELQLVCKAVIEEHKPIVISVFHAFDAPEQNLKEDDHNFISFDEMFSISEKILQRPKKQYYVGYKYTNNNQSLLTALEEEYKKLFFKDKLFFNQRLDHFVKEGSDITATDLFFDIMRAKPENGFKPFYIYRNSVDGKLHQIINGLGYKYLFVTGKPSSGKSRALLECIHHDLKEKKVIVMKTGNVKDVCQNLLHELELHNRIEQEYFFVCDQVKDVLQSAGDSLCKSFLNAINDTPNCKLIGSSTSAALSSFIADNSIIDASRNGNAYIIDIPLLSNDSESQDIMSQIWMKYPKGEGETIGDYITELRDYKSNVARGVIDRAQNDEGSYMSGLLQSLQLVMVFRRTNPLFLAIMILRHLNSEDKETDFKTKTTTCLNYLLSHNVIWINSTEENPQDRLTQIHVEKFEPKDFQFLRKGTYDNERFNSIIPTNYMFTINELIWDVLEDEENKHLKTLDWTSLFFNLYDHEGLQQAIYTFYETFPTVSSLRRFLPRVPKNKKWQEKKEYEERLAETWEFVFEQVKELNPETCDKNELLLAYEMLMGRASSIEQVQAVLKEMHRTNTPITPTSIGELYMFVRLRLSSENSEYYDFIQQIQDLPIQKGKFSYDEIYKIYREIPLLYKDFEKAIAYVRQVFSSIKEKDEQGLDGFDAIRKECQKPDSIVKNTIIRLISMLSSTQHCKTVEHLSTLVRFCKEISLNVPVPVFFAIPRVSQGLNDILSVFSIVFPTDEAVFEQKEQYEQWTATTILGLDNFSTSIALYQRYYQLCKVNKHHDKMISLCLHNCQSYEFGDALKYVLSLPEGCVNPISLNILLSKSPTVENAYFIINMMRKEDCDEFTLGNSLNLIKNYSNNRGSRNRNTALPQNAFFNAYEFVNHPKLKHLRTRPACLRFLYQFATNRSQEEYVNGLVKEEGSNYRVLMNSTISTTLILKPYRTFTQAYYEVFTQVFSYLMDISGKVEPDIFNCMCSLYHSTITNYKEKEKVIEQSGDEASLMRQSLAKEMAETEETKQRLLKDIETVVLRKKIYLDEHFFFNYYVKTIGEPILNDECTEVTDFFKQWFCGKVGNGNFYQISVLQHLLQYYINKGLSPVRTWNIAKTLYLFFEQQFEDCHIVFRPTAEVMSLLLNVAKSKYEQEKKNNTQDFKFIDQEMTKQQVIQDRVLNKKIKSLEDIYKFKYWQAIPPYHNLPAYRNLNIQQAQSVSYILKLLDEEMEQVGTVNPTLINSALERIREIHRFHIKFLANFIPDNNLLNSVNIKSFDYDGQIAKYKEQHKQEGESGEEEVLRILKYLATQPSCYLKFEKVAKQEVAELQDHQYQHIKNLIVDAGLTEKLTFRNYTQLALVCRSKEDRDFWLNKLNETDDFSCISIGQLAMERIIALFNINLSRHFFFKWLDIYKDIYKDKETIARHLPKESWSTIGAHLRWEFEELVKTIRKTEDKYNKNLWIEDIVELYGREKFLGVASCIARIYQLYQLTDTKFRENPFHNTKYLNFDDTILLLCLVYPGKQEEWEKIKTVLKDKF